MRRMMYLAASLMAAAAVFAAVEPEAEAVFLAGFEPACFDRDLRGDRSPAASPVAELPRIGCFAGDTVYADHGCRIGGDHAVGFPAFGTEEQISHSRYRLSFEIRVILLFYHKRLLMSSKCAESAPITAKLLS